MTKAIYTNLYSLLRTICMSMQCVAFIIQLVLKNWFWFQTKNGQKMLIISGHGEWFFLYKWCLHYYIFVWMILRENATRTIFFFRKGSIWHLKARLIGLYFIKRSSLKGLNDNHNRIKELYGFAKTYLPVSKLR